MKYSILVAVLLCAQIVAAQTAPSLYDIPLKDIDGKDTSLKAYQGKVLLIVNVASQCGFTPQYTALQALQDKYKAQGFTVLGFPCNDFGEQEPGTPAEIKAFCSDNYKVTFPLFAKLHVIGPDKHPLYQALNGKNSPFQKDVGWNFGKFLISRDGRIQQYFESKITPDSADVTGGIEKALASKP